MLLCAVQTTKIQNADAVQHHISHVNYIVWITIALTLNCIFHLQIHSYYPPKQQQQLSICKIKIFYFHLISQSSWSNWESKLLGKFIKILWTDSFLQQKVTRNREMLWSYFCLWQKEVTPQIIKNAHTYDQLPINLTWRRATASANVGARIRVV